ncbi:methylenetetrahydrofolate reductase [Haloechinothrix halophila]|uniref:methylenetetrahydrofolate reductase n=1 Tax=Haloechinothrix halophila TaxID=1069073 RepID=UPI0004241D7C|nr:methylenetetrahydrofolate reductase [Haloechinothrix halophila]
MTFQPLTRAPRTRRAVAPLLTAPRYEILPLPGALEATEQLPAGSVVTVTASPHKGLHATIDIAEDVMAQGMRAVPHLAARQFRDSGELSEVLDRLDAAGISEVFVVGGDSQHPAGDFADGLALLRGMADLGRLPAEIGVPSYPEGHHAIDDETLWTSLHAKQDYATYTVTQLCFDADAICRFAAEAQRRGITLPVVVGTPGVVDLTKLLRVGLKIGVGDSLRFARGNYSVAGKLLRPGGYRPDGLVRKLANRVADGHCTLAGLHFYTFNHVAETARWVRQTHRRAA